jgi:hypothetical protein
MLRHGRRQRLAEPRPPHVKRVAELLQGVAEASRRGMLLVQNDQDRMLHESRQRCLKPCTAGRPADRHFAVRASRGC